MRRIQTFGSIAIILAICGLVANPARAQGKPIEIGVMASLSGAIASLGTEYADAIRLAIDTINRDGGIRSLGNRPLHITVYDDESSPPTARTLAAKLTGDNAVSAVIGPYGSGACLAAGPVMEQQKIPMICSGTAVQITQQGFKYVFNRGTLSSAYVAAKIKLLSDLNTSAGARLKKVATVHEDGAMGTEDRTQIVKLAPSAGFEIVSDISFHTGAADLSPEVNRAAGSGAQVLFGAGYLADMIGIIRAVRTLKAPILVIGNSGTVIDPQMAKLGAISEGVIGMTEWAEDINKPGVQPYREQFKAAFGHYPNASAAPGWSDAYFLRQAIETAASTDPQKIRDAIASLKIASGPALDIQPFGTYGFDDDGLAIGQSERVVATQLQNGKFVTIWPAAVAAGKFEPVTSR